VLGPERDRIWNHIDLHNASSKSQHRRLLVLVDTRRAYRDKRVMLVVIDGEGLDVKPVYGAIIAILQKHGVRSAKRKR
jgi:hypothetical protein